MRQKKDRHEQPMFAKGAKNNFKSKSQHSILHKHEQKLQEFKNKNERIKTLDNKIRTTEKELVKIQKDADTCEDEKITQLNRMQTKIQDLTKERDLVASGQDEVDYLLSCSSLVMKYIDLEQREQSLLGESNYTDEQAAELNDIQAQKNELVDTYLNLFEDNYVSTRNMFTSTNVICGDCNEYLEIKNGFRVCPLCGMCYTSIENTGELSYKEMQDYDYRPQFTYDKMTHLEDWLRRFQAKENRMIPQEILDKVVLEAKKERIRDLNTLEEKTVKKYLKRLSLNEYYDNVINIINRINGRPPFMLTAEIEFKVKMMFQQIQEPFEKHKPKDRRNFLSYSYTLHKFFQILGLHEFCKYFPLLKSPDKLRQQDHVFRKIVAEMASKDKTMNWVFYPSI